MQRQITVDDDVYQHLIRNIAEFGESESAVLRRLLGLGRHGATNDGKRPKDEGPPSPLAEFLTSGEFRMAQSATDRFLSILGFAHAQDPDRFGKVLQLSGTRRRYFAKTRQEIERSGKATHPQPVPHSDYWVLTNADTAQKRDLLRRALMGMSYSDHDIRAATAALD